MSTPKKPSILPVRSLQAAIPIAHLKAKTSSTQWGSFEVCHPDDGNAVAVFRHANVNRSVFNDNDVEILAREMERFKRLAYEWTPEQFDIWWEKDEACDRDKMRAMARAGLNSLSLTVGQTAVVDDGAQAAEINRLRLLLTKNILDATHQCRRCFSPYIPQSAVEDCPQCGHDGVEGSTTGNDFSTKPYSTQQFSNLTNQANGFSESTIPVAFHKSASHVEPGYRDGWNACHELFSKAVLPPTQSASDWIDANPEYSKLVLLMLRA